MIKVTSDFINKVKIINVDEELINTTINENMTKGYHVKQITAVKTSNGLPQICILFEKPI